MWPGEQPPGDGQSPQSSGAGQPSNPYQQPGYHQQNPYQQQPPWNAPTQPSGASVPAPTPPSGGGKRTRTIAIVAAAAVVVAAGVTGYAVIGGGKDDKPDPKPTNTASASESSGNPRGTDTDTDTATIEGWKVVVNPDAGIAFDVPPEWALKSPTWISYVVDAKDDDDLSEKPLIAMRAPAFLKEQWCASDEDKDGTKDYTRLAQAGSKGNNGARSTEEIAKNDPKTWVYGLYTQPDKAKVTSGTVEPFTAKSGLQGSLGSAWSTGVKQTEKCDTNGKAWTFAFKNAQGDLASWSFVGVKGVPEEVSDATVRKIASTVRLFKDPTTS
ncbi:hypothetical protein AB0L85_26995 [Streptomyces sp. NPDC052051]|uniref:hypothetical protein n=1 Tax=Streptomyces sp. NPDC052051 TaxID=3154649 RepID=UPI0034204519